MVYVTESRRERLVKFAKDNTKEIEGKYNDGTTWKSRRFNCPCCDFHSWNSISSNDEDSIMTDGIRGYLIHLNAQIRLHASQSHISLFEELFGKEKTDEYLRLAIAKNKAVTNELERIYEKRQELIQVDLTSDKNEK
jgi:hypothetical protein